MSTENFTNRADTINALTERVIGCAFEVSNRLGAGFLEKVYENALMIELKRSAVTAEAQSSIAVKYRNVVVGEYSADILVEKMLLIELKAVKALDDVHRAQCMNYLRATGLPFVCC